MCGDSNALCPKFRHGAARGNKLYIPFPRCTPHPLSHHFPKFKLRTSAHTRKQRTLPPGPASPSSLLSVSIKPQKWCVGRRAARNCGCDKARLEHEILIDCFLCMCRTLKSPTPLSLPSSRRRGRSARSRTAGSSSTSSWISATRRCVVLLPS